MIGSYRSIPLETLGYARDRDYVGRDKHDGMSSRLRRAPGRDGVDDPSRTDRTGEE